MNALPFLWTVHSSYKDCRQGLRECVRLEHGNNSREAINWYVCQYPHHAAYGLLRLRVYRTIQTPIEYEIGRETAEWITGQPIRLWRFPYPGNPLNPLDSHKLIR